MYGSSARGACSYQKTSQPNGAHAAVNIIASARGARVDPRALEGIKSSGYGARAALDSLPGVSQVKAPCPGVFNLSVIVDVFLAGINSHAHGFL